jgi:hypothetical protein
MRFKAEEKLCKNVTASNPALWFPSGLSELSGLDNSIRWGNGIFMEISRQLQTTLPTFPKKILTQLKTLPG